MKGCENPHDLSKLYIEIAADYGFFSSLLIGIKEKKTQEWVDIKKSGGEKLLSDKYTDMMYKLTDNGKYEQLIEIKMKSMEKMMSALKNYQYTLNQESRNQY
jgi:hypothetical protein